MLKLICLIFLFLFPLLSNAVKAEPPIESYVNVGHQSHHHEVNEEEVGIYKLTKGNISATFTNFGARIISFLVPDKYGKLADVVLGYDTTKEYKNDGNHFGAIVGRVANRIGGAQFTLNGTLYKLIANDGNNTLHGGPKGFSMVTWNVETYHPESRFPYITFSYLSRDGEQGFPGDLEVKVTYTLSDQNELLIAMVAIPLTKATPVNLANHAYWNLKGHNKGDILSHKVRIFSTFITPTDETLIPTGKLLSVKGTPYDFLKAHDVGSRIGKLTSGYDINYVVDEFRLGDVNLNRVAVVKEMVSGRVMELWANQAGVQFYTSYWLNGVVGKGGYVYRPYGALCLETQAFPDAVNHDNFPSVIVQPGEKYEHYMVLKFSTMVKR